MNIELDPLNHYDGVPPNRLLEVCGLLPSFIPRRDLPAKEQLNMAYPFGENWVGGDGTDRYTWTSDGTYSYPGDPTQFPVAKIDLDTEEVFIYEHAMVSVRNKDDGTFIIQRMD